MLLGAGRMLMGARRAGYRVYIHRSRKLDETNWRRNQGGKGAGLVDPHAPPPIQCHIGIVTCYRSRNHANRAGPALMVTLACTTAAKRPFGFIEVDYI